MIDPMVDVYGVFLPSFLVAAILAWFSLVVLRKVLVRVGFYRATFHSALIDLALFVLLLAGITAVFVGR
ncbi:hypothetical protein TH25_02765 [Thalassospira profundimaris]|jgi:hypothetical protein|uniref:DUF1656 domain-containing protein n=1 Tax=Thalassospira profundimaris TaxID=502049 RepID=A0A367XNC2_9PROT|nr:DUF1656 domain-containing protein [Thalassospira profundimaris]RCK54242.1 hypothetical protein TH25_02765 [Thalassospira profundimaris]|tara:strand:+ start:210 stop:416 length:207 start_codon:yes stop_codon:yes gene_type:complete